jgi:uncharacterized protein (DUF2336 family)
MDPLQTLAALCVYAWGFFLLFKVTTAFLSDLRVWRNAKKRQLWQTLRMWRSWERQALYNEQQKELKRNQWLSKDQ